MLVAHLNFTLNLTLALSNHMNWIFTFSTHNKKVRKRPTNFCLNNSSLNSTKNNPCKIVSYIWSSTYSLTNRRCNRRLAKSAYTSSSLKTSKALSNLSGCTPGKPSQLASTWTPWELSRWTHFQPFPVFPGKLSVDRRIELPTQADLLLGWSPPVCHSAHGKPWLLRS